MWKDKIPKRTDFQSTQLPFRDVVLHPIGNPRKSKMWGVWHSWTPQQAQILDVALRAVSLQRIWIAGRQLTERLPMAKKIQTLMKAVYTDNKWNDKTNDNETIIIMFLNLNEALILYIDSTYTVTFVNRDYHMYICTWALLPSSAYRVALFLRILKAEWVI